MVSIFVADAFQNSISQGINIFAGGRDSVDSVATTNQEQLTIQYVFNQGLKLLQKVSPSIAGDISSQLQAAQTFASIAKAAISTTGGTKPIVYPSVPGGVGVAWATPEMIRYIATRSATNSAYTDYAADTWILSVTAGIPSYILGSGTYNAQTPPTTAPTLTSSNYFQGAQQSQAHSMYFFFQNGLVEIGTTPKYQQFQFYTSLQQKYGIWTVNPINEMPVETDKAIYQYSTIGAFPVFFDSGVTWAAMPIITGQANVKPLGFCFYEHAFAPTLVYV